MIVTIRRRSRHGRSSLGLEHLWISMHKSCSKQNLGSGQDCISARVRDATIQKQRHSARIFVSITGANQTDPAGPQEGEGNLTPGTARGGPSLCKKTMGDLALCQFRMYTISSCFKRTSGPKLASDTGDVCTNPKAPLGTRPVQFLPQAVAPSLQKPENPTLLLDGC